MEIKSELRKEWNKSILEIRTDQVCQEEYQIEMLKNNTLTGVLPFTFHGENGEMVYEYDVTGMISLKEKYQKEKLYRKDMEQMLSGIQRVAEEVESYFLNPGRILLRSDFVFLQGEEYRFCYFPYGTEELLKSFHQLMDDFVKWTDYQDIPSVKAAFLLHRESMEKRQSLKQIEEKLAGLSLELDIRSVEEKKERATENMSETVVLEEVESQRESLRRQNELWRAEDSKMSGYEWMVHQGREAMMMEEKTGFFAPVKRFLGRRKKPKWGEWDNIEL